MPRHHQTLAILAIIIVCLSGAYLAVRHNNAVGDASTGVGTELPDQEYENVTYGFSFAYPAGADLNEYTSRYIGVADHASGKTLVDVTIAFASEERTFESISDFAHAQAALSCDADGPTGSVRCPGSTRTQEFVSASGVKGEVFYLSYVATYGDERTEREAGPFYAFDISHNGAEGPFGIVLVGLSHSAEESGAYDAGAAIAHRIADSFKFIAAVE